MSTILRVAALAALAACALPDRTARQYLQVVVESGPESGGTVVSDPRGVRCRTACDSPFAPGKLIMLTARPDPSSKFIGWDGDCVGVGVCFLDMDEGKRAVAQFAAAGAAIREKHRFARAPYLTKVSSVAADASGDVFVGGLFSSVIELGDSQIKAPSQASAIYLARVTDTGSIVWRQVIGGDYSSFFYDLGVANGQLVVMGNAFGKTRFEEGTGDLKDLPMRSVPFVARYDAATGVLVQVDSFPDEKDRSYQDMALDADGNAILVGTLFASNENRDLQVTKINAADGKFAWSIAMGTGGVDFARRVAVDALGNVVLVGRFDSSSGVFKDPSSSLTTRGKGGNDGIVVKLSPDGDALWLRPIGGRYDDDTLGVQVDSAGDVFLLGSLSEAGLEGERTGKLLLAKLSGVDGEEVWRREETIDGSPSPQPLAIDKTGDLVLAVSFVGVVDLGGGEVVAERQGSVLLAKLSGSDGAHRWSRTLGEMGGWPPLVTIHPTGDLEVIVHQVATVDPEDDDMYLVRLSP